MITKERLANRVEELKIELEKARQQFHVLTGALADAEFLLNEASLEDKGEDKKEE